MVKVRRSGAPCIVEVAQLLLAEVTGDFIREPDFEPQIFVGQVFKPHFAGTPDIERDRPISFVAHRAMLAAVIEEGADDVGIEQNLYLVPVMRAKTAVRRL